MANEAYGRYARAKAGGYDGYTDGGGICGAVGRGQGTHPRGAVRGAQGGQQRADRTVLGHRTADRGAAAGHDAWEVRGGKTSKGFASGVPRDCWVFGREPLAHAGVLRGIRSIRETRTNGARNWLDAQPDHPGAVQG